MCEFQRTLPADAIGMADLIPLESIYDSYRKNSKRVDYYQVVGLIGLEPMTLRLSSACSNQLSYRPKN
jgi:hypothetical protein